MFIELSRYETFPFQVFDPEAILKISVYDEDYARDEFMCSVSIPVTSLLEHNKKMLEQWYKLSGENENDDGPQIVDSAPMRDLMCPMGALLIGKRCRLQQVPKPVPVGLLGSLTIYGHELEAFFAGLKRSD